MKLDDLCDVRTNFPEADFWIIRRGSIEAVGKPIKTFSKEAIGIKVVSDALVPDYLYYWFMHLHASGIFQQLATGSLRLVNIRTADIAHLPVSFR